jgi:zinc transporter 1
MSIFLEAIQRLVEPQEVKNPKLVCIVGCLGLLSNILGLALFHEHSHGHGDHGHSHGEEGDLHATEEGHSHEHTTAELADERGTDASIMVGNVVGVLRSDGPDVGEGPQIVGNHSRRFTKSDERSAAAAAPLSPTSRRSRAREIHKRQSRAFSGSGSRGFDSLDNIHVHPADRYQNIIAASHFDDEESLESEEDNQGANGEAPVSEYSNLLGHKDRANSYTDESDSAPLKPQVAPEVDVHRSHNHARPKTGKKGHGHFHGDLNMKGVFLHVMGDALGNIGVIASALIIWLTDYEWRFYVDPGISLVITLIILCSAIPLCKAASRILLQAVPAGMSIDHIQEDINSIRGVISSHHLHVWQLSGTKLVASLHVRIGSEIKDEGSESYMELVKEVQRCLHAYGIHSSTIQPEFVTGCDIEDQYGSSATQPGSRDDGSSTRQPSRATSLRDEPTACLLECGDECPGGKCCPIPKK